MDLKSQDIYVASKLFVLQHEPCSMQWLGESLGLSASQVHSAIQRLIKAHLLRKDTSYQMMTTNFQAHLLKQQKKRQVWRYQVIAANFQTFLLHGIRFVFVPELGEPCRGIPTSSFAPPLRQHFSSNHDLPYVWPDPQGEVRGISFSPLHKHVSTGARNDPKLYELLALIDAMRGGRARERHLASEYIQRLCA